MENCDNCETFKLRIKQLEDDYHRLLFGKVFENEEHATKKRKISDEVKEDKIPEFLWSLYDALKKIGVKNLPEDMFADLESARKFLSNVKTLETDGLKFIVSNVENSLLTQKKLFGNFLEEIKSLKDSFMEEIQTEIYSKIRDLFPESNSQNFISHIIKLHEEFKVLELLNAELKDELKETIQNLSEASKLNQTKNEQIKTLEQVNNQIVSNYEKKLSDLTSRQSELIQSLQKEKDLIGGLERELEALKKDNEKLNDLLSSNENSLKLEFQNQITLLKSEGEVKIELMKKEHFKQIVVLQEEKEKMNKIVSDFKLEVERLNKILSSLVIQEQKLKMEKEVFLIELGHLKTENTLLQDVKTSKIKIEKELSEAQKQAKNFVSQITSLQKEASDLKSEREITKKVIAELEKDKIALQNEVSVLTSEKEYIEKKNKEISDKISVLESHKENSILISPTQHEKQNSVILGPQSPFCPQSKDSSFALSSNPKKIVVSFSGFRNKTEYNIQLKQTLSEMLRNLGAVVKSDGEFENEITHVITPPHSRTLKTFAACLTSKWLITDYNWVIDSFKAKKFLSEEKYGKIYFEKPFEKKRFFVAESFYNESKGQKEFRIENLKNIISLFGKGSFVENVQQADYVIVGVEEKGNFHVPSLTWTSLIQKIPGSQSLLG